jgi:hypothetical protein
MGKSKSTKSQKPLPQASRELAEPVRLLQVTA